MKSFLSLFVSISMLLSYAPIVAGQRLVVPEKTMSLDKEMFAEPLPSDTTAWPEQFKQKIQVLEKRVQQEVDSADDKLLKEGKKMAQNMCPYNSLPCMDEVAFNALQQANWKPENAQVCNEEQKNCVSLFAFAQGGIRWALDEMLSYQGQLIVESADNFTNLVVTYGVNTEEDRQDAISYFNALIDAAHSDCGKTYMEYGSSSRRADARGNTQHTQERCSQEITGLYGLAMLSKTNRENQQTIKQIVSLLNEKYDSAAAGLVIPAAATALATIGTEGAYQALYTFLMDESLPTTMGNLLNVSVKSGAQAALRASSNIRGGNSRYLNRINEQFQYLDKAEASRQGFKNTNFQHENLQYPYGNILEDIGRLLGEESTRNANAAQTAKQIISQANNYVKYGTASGKDLSWVPGTVNAAGKIHYPVVLGILDGWRTQGKKFIYVPSPELLTLFYKGDWWDINEGTQQRVHYKAWRFAKARGWSWKTPVKDKAKEERSVYNERLLNVGEGADAALTPIFLSTLIAATPAMARSLTSTVRWLQTNRKYIGMRLSSRVRPGVVVQKASAAPSSDGIRMANLARRNTAAGKRKVPAASTQVTRPAPVQTTAPRMVKAGTEPSAPVGPSLVSVSAKAPVREPRLASVSRAKTDNHLFGGLNKKIQAVKQNKAGVSVSGQKNNLDADADLERFLDGKPLIARGVDNTPKSGGFFSKIFKSKTQKILDGVSEELANLPQDPAARMQKLQQLNQRLVLDQGTVAKATQEEIRTLSGLKWKITSQMRSAQNANSPGIEIVHRSAQAAQTQPRGAALAETSAAPLPQRQALPPASSSRSVARDIRAPSVPVSNAGSNTAPVMRVGDVLDGSKVLGTSEKAVAGRVSSVAQNTAPAAEKTSRQGHIFSDAASAQIIEPRTWSRPGKVQLRFQDGRVEQWTVSDYELMLKTAPKEVQGRLPQITSAEVRAAAPADIAASRPNSAPVPTAPAAATPAAPVREAASPVSVQPMSSGGQIAAGRTAAPVMAKTAGQSRLTAEQNAANAFFKDMQAINRTSRPGEVVVRYKDGSQKIVSLEEYNALRAQGLGQNKSLISRVESNDFLYDLQGVRREGKYVYLEYANKAKPVRRYADEYETMVKQLGPQEQAQLQAIENKNLASVKAIDGNYVEVRYADGNIKHLTLEQSARMRVPVPQSELNKMALLKGEEAAAKELQNAGLTRLSRLSEREIVPEITNNSARGTSKLLQDGLARIEHSGTDMRSVNMYFLDKKGNVSMRTVSYGQYQDMISGWSKADANLLHNRTVQYADKINYARAREEIKLLDALRNKYRGATPGGKNVIRQEALPIIDDLSSNKMITAQRQKWWMDKFQ